MFRLGFFRKKDSRFERIPFESIETFDYIGQESLLGAIFSDDIDNYECVMDKVFDELNRVSLMYKDRIKKITLSFDDQTF